MSGKIMICSENFLYVPIQRGLATPRIELCNLSKLAVQSISVRSISKWELHLISKVLLFISDIVICIHTKFISHNLILR